MPLILACPACTGKLRVLDNLLGSPVRCPHCKSTFPASEEPTPVGPPAPPPPPPVYDIPLDEPAPLPVAPSPPLELPLELTLEEPAPASTARGLQGAVEIPLKPESDPAPVLEALPVDPPARSERAAPVQRAARPEDLRECPCCGRQVPRKARDCPSCDEPLKEEDPERERERQRERERRQREEKRKERERERDPEERKRDREMLDSLRRDMEPHRGTLVLTLGIISLCLIAVMLFPIGVIVGLTAWLMGRSDLRKIQAHEMDPTGLGATQAGWVCGLIATILNTLGTVSCFLFLGYVINEEYRRPPRPAPGQRRPKPPPMQPR